MILLDTTSKKLQLITSSAANVDVVVNYVDRNQSTGAISGDGSQTTAIAAVGTNDILAVPGATTTRNAVEIFIRNKHASLACDVTPLMDVGGTDYELHKETLQPGEMLEYVQGLGFFKMAAASSSEFGDVIERRLDATQTGTNGTAAQNWFPTNGAPNVQAGVVYEFDGLLNMTRAAGTTSHTTSLLFGGTATLTYILWRSHCNTGDTLANAAQNHAAGRSASAVVVKAASTSTTEEVSLRVEGSVKINAAGTFIPQFSYSAAPGGAPTIQIGSFFNLVRKGVGFNTKGTWS